MLIRNSDRPRLTARFDNAHLPAGESCKRLLLLEVEAPVDVESFGSLSPREAEQSLNLALVIDRSGSMARGRLDAAKRAAAELCQELSERDRLSLVSFDHEVKAHFKGRAMSERGRRRALSKIHELRARGTTNLAAGWHAGATCAAEVRSERGFDRGHVIVLSDGRANRGLCDPEEIQKHARETATRGVRTSAVGIGNRYSPLQLDALAEGGGGQLHDSAHGEELAAMLLGEARELRETLIRDVALTLHGPENIVVPFVTHTPIEAEPGRMKFALGDLPAGRKRVVGLLLSVPPCIPGQRLGFRAELAWSLPNGSTEATPDDDKIKLTDLTPVEPGAPSVQLRDLDMVEQFADLYEAALIYQVAVLNERGEYNQAIGLVTQHRPHLEHLARALPDEDERLERLKRLARRAPSRTWGDRSKRTTLGGSKGDRDLKENFSIDKNWKNNF